MVLQVTVTVRHQKSAHAYGSDGEVWNVPGYTHLLAAYIQSLDLAHSTLLSVTATHATALDLFWHRCSTRRVTSLHRWVIRAVKMLPLEIKTTQQQCKLVLRPWLSHIFLSLLSQVCRLFMHLRIGGECILPVIMFYSNYFILFFFSTYVLFFK